MQRRQEIAPKQAHPISTTIDLRKHNLQFQATNAMATLKPPTNTHRSSSSSSGPPKAPLKADPTATIADNVVFQGTYPVTIGAGTVIHPRAKFYAFEGPIIIGDGCIISEKAMIGAPPQPSSRATSPSPSPSRDPTETTPTSKKESTTRISYFVTIGPSATIEPGVHIHSSATIEALAIIRRGTDIGSHAKVCSACEIAGGSVGEWVVVWGSGPGMRRKRAKTVKSLSPAVVGAAVVAQTALPASAPAGKVIEDARLMVLQKEREVLGRMLVPAVKKK
jgi:UDP-3-O-[3-hydroxymyristoyl] glucosamine N-acyltransferase